jgi:hypothetical protein
MHDSKLPGRMRGQAVNLPGRMRGQAVNRESTGRELGCFGAAWGQIVNREHFRSSRLHGLAMVKRPERHAVIIPGRARQSRFTAWPRRPVAFKRGQAVNRERGCASGGRARGQAMKREP